MKFHQVCSLSWESVFSYLWPCLNSRAALFFQRYSEGVRNSPSSFWFLKGSYVSYFSVTWTLWHIRKVIQKSNEKSYDIMLPVHILTFIGRIYLCASYTVFASWAKVKLCKLASENESIQNQNNIYLYRLCFMCSEKVLQCGFPTFGWHRCS